MMLPGENQRKRKRKEEKTIGESKTVRV